MLIAIYTTILHLSSTYHSRDITTLQELDDYVKRIIGNPLSRFYRNTLTDQYRVLLRVFIVFNRLNLRKGISTGK